jgi:hypothetical protein
MLFTGKEDMWTGAYSGTIVRLILDGGMLKRFLSIFMMAVKITLLKAVYLITLVSVVTYFLNFAALELLKMRYSFKKRRVNV